MLFARILLIVQVVILTVLALAYLIRPQEMANLSGALLMESSAVTDVRAWYGGLQLGLAFYLLLAPRAGQVRPALFLLLVLYTALALGRVLGLVLDGGAQQTFNFAVLLFEAVSAALAWSALRRL